MNRAERIERVLRRMAAERIDTLIALSNAKHHLARINLAAHLMGYRALGESALVLRADDSNRSAEVELAQGADPQVLLRRLVEAGAQLERFELVRSSLHQIFLETVGANGVEPGVIGDE